MGGCQLARTEFVRASSASGGPKYHTIATRRSSEPGHCQPQARGVFRIVQDLLVGDAQTCGISQGLAGPRISHVERVSTARHLKSDPVATGKSVGRWPHDDPNRDRSVP